MRSPFALLGLLLAAVVASCSSSSSHTTSNACGAIAAECCNGTACDDGLTCLANVCIPATAHVDGGHTEDSGCVGSACSGTGTGSSSTSGSHASSSGHGGSSSSSGSTGACQYASTDTTDHDGDGWSPADGDCNDCNKYVNPGAYDVPGDGVDEDCNGVPDDEPTGCDSTLTSVATTVATDGAMAMDLCRTAVASPPGATRTWGVVSADYVLPDGTASASPANFALGFGILGPTFGTSNTTRQGMHMLGLSSGTARQPTDPGYENVATGFDKGYTSGAPTGFPGQAPACGNITFGTPHDGAALRLVIRVPTNAVTMSFNSNLFSSEFPEYVCSVYNDTYVAIMTPSPSGEPVAAKENVAFDTGGNAISIDGLFLRVCTPTTTAGSAGGGSMMGAYAYSCPEGPAKLLGTGFGIDNTATSPAENHASTDWLTTTVSVAALQGQEMTLLFAVWDSSDGLFDTTVLIDNLHWAFATAADTVPMSAAPITVGD